MMQNLNKNKQKVWNLQIQHLNIFFFEKWPILNFDLFQLYWTLEGVT